MPPALTLLIAAAVPTAAAADLSFRTGRLDGWQGAGFCVTSATAVGPSRSFGVSSGDDGRAGHKALLYQTFVVPSDAAEIRFTAAALRPRGRQPGPALDVVLEAAERRFIPKSVRGADGLRPAPALLPPENGRPREYVWPVAAHAGELVRIALIDDDDRTDCHVFCSGFRFVSADEVNGRAFAAVMRGLEQTKRLPPMTRLDSDHFLAIGDADDEDIQRRLYNCETIYALFFDHFRRRGFAVRPPAERMMLAVFDSQGGFEAYLGRGMSTAVTGLYDRESNRLAVYDYAGNRAFQEAKRRGDAFARSMPASLERQRLVGAFGREMRAFRDDADIGTVMHEVAHQLSFNGGLLNRDGDVPLWLAEGLACYCESTANGAWQGVGEPNPMRVGTLAVRLRGGGPLLPLRELIAGDDWLRGATAGQAALGYAQSWALFRLLMEEEPGPLRRYLELIGGQRTADRRLDDFVDAFGSFSRMDARYQEYVRDLVRREAPRQR